MDKSTLDRELSRAKVLCIRKNFKEAAEIYQSIIDEEFDNLEANLGLLRAHSENFTNHDNPEIDSDIEVIESLWPNLDDEDFRKFKNAKDEGFGTVTLSNAQKLRLAEEALEREREEIESYLSFVPEETLEFFPWYDSLDELKEDVYKKCILLLGSYERNKIKEYNDNPYSNWENSYLCLKFDYASYYISYVHDFSENSAPLHIAIWLNEIKKGNDKYYLRIIYDTIAQDLRDYKRFYEYAYSQKLKKYDENKYNQLVYKYVKMYVDIILANNNLDPTSATYWKNMVSSLALKAGIQDEQLSTELVDFIDQECLDLYPWYESIENLKKAVLEVKMNENEYIRRFLCLFYLDFNVPSFSIAPVFIDRNGLDYGMQGNSGDFLLEDYRKKFKSYNEKMFYEQAAKWWLKKYLDEKRLSYSPVSYKASYNVYKFYEKLAKKTK